MEVVYVSICDEIMKANLKADLNNRTIKEIILTKYEVRELRKELFGQLKFPDHTVIPGYIGQYDGVLLKQMEVI